MGRTSMRKIIVNETEFNWCIKGNHLDSSKPAHYTVFLPGVNGQTLYVDPYVWDLPVGPKTIQRAILFALKNSWNPKQNGKPLYLGYKEDEFLILPEDVKFTYELQ